MPRTRAPPPASSPEHNAKGYAKEADVLHPVDKRKPDDDWPTFPLRNATVFGKLLAGFENLLMVEQRGPFPIRGRVAIDRTDALHVEARTCHPRPRDSFAKYPLTRPLLVRSSRIPRYIDIELLAYRMSIGYDLDPDSDEEVAVPAVWAATDYGFFRLLRAGPEYTPILDKTFEAITLYYTVQDIYAKHAEEGKRRRSLDVDEVLFRVSLRPRLSRRRHAARRANVALVCGRYRRGSRKGRGHRSMPRTLRIPGEPLSEGHRV